MCAGRMDTYACVCSTLTSVYGIAPSPHRHRTACLPLCAAVCRCALQGEAVSKQWADRVLQIALRPASVSPAPTMGLPPAAIHQLAPNPGYPHAHPGYPNPNPGYPHAHPGYPHGHPMPNPPIAVVQSPYGAAATPYSVAAVPAGPSAHTTPADRTNPYPYPYPYPSLRYAVAPFLCCTCARVRTHVLYVCVRAGSCVVWVVCCVCVHPRVLCVSCAACVLCVSCAACVVRVMCGVCVVRVVCGCCVCALVQTAPPQTSLV